MQTTKTLGSLKHLFVQQPLPLTKRDSQKLLKTLTTSFRAHLDREHGLAHDLSQPVATAPTISRSELASTADSSSQLSASRQILTHPHRPVDRHLQAVLNNPLFSHNGTSKLASPHGLGAELDTHPKAVFEAAVARGIMTIPRALGFLLKSKQVITQSGVASVSKAMAEYGAGLLVLNWLRSSGLERQLAFLENQRFTPLLLEFMVAEGLDDLAWVWLERMCTQGGGQASSHNPGRFLRALVDANYINTVELETAYRLMLRGDALFKKSDRIPFDLRPAWLSLAWETTGHSWRHTPPEASVYDAFLDLPKLYNSNLVMHKAHLELYHPTKPSHDRAVEYIMSRKTDSDAFTDTSPRSARFRDKCTALALDTCQRLLSLDEVKLAQDVLKKVQDLGLGQFPGHDYLVSDQDLKSLGIFRA
ncbi:hypothetical protein QBC37DRAFT_423274 [Rhypophila decipiens]|uniref:Uncharacterized protein n=1 Tax=Rhypophila decipiens TaxID=261697 RepID=A0AAN6Y612_9PEZI|nr:hypothetical protein QBC37DRAFT_423274 [Rhypophila decipiens]